MKKFLKQKMAADPVLSKDIELDFHEESLVVLENEGYCTTTQNTIYQQTVENPFYDSAPYLENLKNENESPVKIDQQGAVDPKKQKILNTIFHFRNKKPVIGTDLMQNAYLSDDDSDNEKVFFPKSILKKEPKEKKNNVHFGYDELHLYDKYSPIIPIPEKPTENTPKKLSRKKASRSKRGNRKTKKNVKVQPEKQRNIFETNDMENSGNEELTIAEQIILAEAMNLLRNAYLSDDDPDNEIFFPKSILKKEPKRKTKGKKNVHFGYEKLHMYDKYSSIIPIPEKTSKKLSKKKAKSKRGNRKTKKNVKVQPEKEANIFQTNYMENSIGNEEFTIAEQILLAKPMKTEREKKIDYKEEKEEDISDVEENESSKCNKNKKNTVDIPEESNAKKIYKRKSQENSDDRQNKTIKVLAEKSDSHQRNDKAVSLNNDGHQKLSTEILANLCVFENCTTQAQVKPLVDLQKKEIEQVANSTSLNLNLFKESIVNEWKINVKQFYPQK